jgi:two-component system sensor histidine kinase ChiS
MPTVLVIDEHRATLDTIGRALRGAGFSVALASTGQDGLRLAGQRAIDLVVADLRLPDIEDVEVLKLLRQVLSDVPVIVTGLASTASAIEAGKLGAVDYVEKPVFEDHLVQLARTYVPLPRPATLAAHDQMRVSPPVIRAMHVIEKRYIETSLHVSAVAQDLGVSTEHLCRVVKRHTGLTFVTLLRRARVRAACRLLQTTALSMKEIAGRAGFSSASRFDRDFKQVCGVSPSEYRAGFWRQPNTRS